MEHDDAVAFRKALPEWMTLDEVAGHLRVTRRTVHRWQAQGRLRVVKLSMGRGGRAVIRRDELERFLREAETSGDQRS